MHALTTGDLACAAGVGVETVRYYERRGLLPAPARTDAGYRQYEPDAVRRIRFIKHAQALGFTLDEIAELLALRVDPAGNCDAVQVRAERAMERIDVKLGQLHRMRSALAQLVDSCRHAGPTSECPVLEALEEEA
jgi:Hg(II)-responsive transcriptional regulator